MPSFGQYAQGGLGGAAAGAGTGAMLGSVVPGVGTGIGAAVGGGLGLLNGLFGVKQAGDSAAGQKSAIDAAIAASQANSKQQQQFHMGAERLGQSYVSPMDDLYRHFYGQGAPGVQNQGQQDTAENIRRDMSQGFAPTSMRGAPPPAGTPPTTLGPPIPGQPGWYGTPAQQPAPPKAPPMNPPTGKPVGFR